MTRRNDLHTRTVEAAAAHEKHATHPEPPPDVRPDDVPTGDVEPCHLPGCERHWVCRWQNSGRWSE